MRNISPAIDQAWDSPVYYEPVRIRPPHRAYALSVSLALALVTIGVTGALVYHRLDTLSDIGTYATMGPSQSHIEADQAASEPTLLVTLTPPAYASVPTANYAVAAPPAVRVSAHLVDAEVIADRLTDETVAKAAEDTASDPSMAANAETPVAAGSLADTTDPVVALFAETPADDSSN